MPKVRAGAAAVSCKQSAIQASQVSRLERGWLAGELSDAAARPETLERWPPKRSSVEGEKRQELVLSQREPRQDSENPCQGPRVVGARSCRTRLGSRTDRAATSCCSRSRVLTGGRWSGAIVQRFAGRFVILPCPEQVSTGGPRPTVALKRDQGCMAGPRRRRSILFFVGAGRAGIGQRRAAPAGGTRSATPTTACPGPGR